MSTFTMNVIPTSKNLFLYPNSDVSQQLTAVGSTNHYDTINEVYDVPDESDYIYTTSISQVTDKFGMTDHTTETGSINYVQLYARGKSHLYTPASSSTYDLLLGVKDASTTTWHYYKSSEATYGTRNNVTTDYNLFSCMWTSNPSSNAGWTWTDIDNLNSGILCSSPSVLTDTDVYTTFLPYSAGSVTQLAYTGATANYDCVNDTIPDYDTSYVYCGYAENKYDCYKLESYIVKGITGTEAITEISVFQLVATNTDQEHRSYTGVRVNGNTYYSSNHTFNDSWNYFSDTWTSNPSTSLAWTWSSVASLEIICGLQQIGGGTGGYPKCTQTYAIIKHKYTGNPEIRTSNIYLKINYTPSTATYYLNMPSSYSFSNNRELKKINFWNGSRKVYDLQRSNKTLNMNGLEYNTSTSEATSRMNNMITLKDEGSQISITGFDDYNLNTSWYIRDFTYSRDTTNPNVFNWDMQLEKA